MNEYDKSALSIMGFFLVLHILGSLITIGFYEMLGFSDVIMLGVMLGFTFLIILCSCAFLSQLADEMRKNG